MFYSLEEWARTGPSRPLQGAARRPRLTSLAMMSRRVVERRRVIEEVVGSVDERSAVGCKPGAPCPRQARRRLTAKARAGAIPKRAQHVKGSSVTRVTLRTAM